MLKMSQYDEAPRQEKKAAVLSVMLPLSIVATLIIGLVIGIGATVKNYYDFATLEIPPCTASISDRPLDVRDMIVDRGKN